jgi:hypothetical protein
MVLNGFVSVNVREGWVVEELIGFIADQVVIPEPGANLPGWFCI